MGKLRNVLAKNIRKLRAELDISQEELAFRSELHRTYISDIERSNRNVSIDNIEKIALALKVKPACLMENKDTNC